METNKKKNSGVGCIIGIVGLPGAGKTTVATYIVKRKFAHIILSDFIREEIIHRGMNDFSRSVYQRVGNDMREKSGGDVLAARALEKIRKEHVKLAVIDGIRNVQEITYLRTYKGFHLLGVSANSRLRFKRLSDRLKTDKQIHRSYAEFLKEEKREDSLGSKKNGLRVSESLKDADVIVQNTAGRKILYSRIDSLITTWRKEI